MIVSLEPNQITTSTYNQIISFDEGFPTTFSFNREFYCIVDHDKEISSNGLIFFGVTESPVITLENKEIEKFQTLFSVFIDEFSTKDDIQGKMLRMLLKRLIIKITRIVKLNQQLIDVPENRLSVVRRLNVLVEENYQIKHHVADYADLLFKSPKTLSI